MKTRLAFLLAIAVTAIAQSVFTLEESTPFDLAYDHTSLNATRIYANGVLVREFSTSEVRLVSNNGTNNTYAITMPGVSKGNFNFVATVFYMNGTNVVESDPSNVLPIQFRPRKPGNLRRF